MAPLVSVVLPWYRKLSLFQRSIAQNRLFLDPRVEVVIAMDEPSEEAGVLQVISQHPDIRFRVIVNDAKHEWRPPCVAINVGIRNSLGTFVAVMSPESMLNPPTNDYLFKILSAQTRSRFFITGQLYHINFTLLETHMDRYAFADVVEYRRSMLTDVEVNAFGFILFPKKVMELIGGYDESRKFYGGDDDDVRARLRLLGCQEINDPNLRLVHMWHEGEYRALATEPFGQKIVLDNQPDWGKEFTRKLYDHLKP